MELNLDLIELKKEVFDFLEKGIKSTPENFKVIIDEVNEFNKKCDADLAIWASAAYDGWGAFRYMEIKISEGIPSNDDPNYVVLGENTMRELQHKDNIHRFILNYLEKNTQFLMKIMKITMMSSLMIFMKNYVDFLKKMKSLIFIRKIIIT